VWGRRRGERKRGEPHFFFLLPPLRSHQEPHPLAADLTHTTPPSY
jgi:hypothetical protein